MAHLTYLVGPSLGTVEPDKPSGRAALVLRGWSPAQVRPLGPLSMRGPEKHGNEVFNDIVGKEFKARGYYDDKYWSQVQVSQGLTFVTQSEEERMYQEKINALENKMECMSGAMKYWVLLCQKSIQKTI